MLSQKSLDLIEKEPVNSSMSVAGAPRGPGSALLSEPLVASLTVDAPAMGISFGKLVAAVAALIPLLREYGPEFWAVFKQIVESLQSKGHAKP